MTVQEIGDEFTVLSHQGKAQAKVMYVSGGVIKEAAGVEMIGDDIALLTTEKGSRSEKKAETNYKEKLVQAVADFVEEKNPDYKKDVIKHQTLRTLLIEFTSKREEELKANFDYVLEGKDLEIKELKEDLRNKKIAIQNKKAEIKQLSKRCNQLLKDKGDLTDELKHQKDMHAEEVELHLHAEEYAKSLEKELAEWKEEWQEQVQKAIDEGWERTKLTGKVRELEQQIEKIKADLIVAIEDANRWEETETFSVLNSIYNDNFEITKGVSN